MDKMRIGVLIDTVYPFTHGGAEKRYALLMQDLAARGHDVTVYSMKWWPGPRSRMVKGVRHVALADPSPLYADAARRSLLQPARFALAAMQGYGPGERPDILDCNQFPFVHLPAAKVGTVLARQPMVVTWHEVWGAYWFDYAPFPTGLVGAALEDVVSGLAATNVAVSHHTARRLRRMGARPDRIEVVPNAIDLAAIDAAPPRGPQADVVFVGRLIRHKRVDRILAAMAKLRRRLPEATCAIVGSGPEEPRLRALARGLGLDDAVTFTGALQDEQDLLGVLKSGRVFVSASEREGFGIAALEAMACRLPVVTVDAPLNALAGELVQHGVNGLGAGLRARALADALGDALGDERTRRSMAQAARATAEEFDRGPVADRLERVYRAALGQEPIATAPRKARRRVAAVAR
jgi:L-malate glycosyltransferase